MRDSDHLKDLLSRELTRLRQAATESDGKLDPNRVDALERLARVVDVAERTEDKPPPRRWPVAAAFVFTLLIVTVLVFSRVSTTQVELDLKVSEVRFDLPRHQQITGEIAVSALSAAGLRAVGMPRAKDPDGDSVSRSEKSWSHVRLSLPKDGGEENQLTFAALVPPAGTRLWVRKTDVPGQFALSLKHEGVTLKANVRGRAEIAAQGSPAQTWGFGRVGRAIEFRAGSEVIDVAFAPASGTDVRLTGPIAARNLWLQRAHENVVGGGPVSYSTILGGALYLVSVADRKYVLRPGELLRFASADGDLRTLKLTKDHIALSFRGTVSGMTTGTESDTRSLMPTYLDWLQSHHALSLLWGTGLYLFGLAAAAIRWWRTGA